MDTSASLRLLIFLLSVLLVGCGGGGGAGGGSGVSALSTSSLLLSPSASPASSAVGMGSSSANFDVLSGIPTTSTSIFSTSASGTSPINVSGSTITYAGADYTFDGQFVVGTRNPDPMSSNSFYGSIVDRTDSLIVSRLSYGTGSLLFFARGTNLSGSNRTIDSLSVYTTTTTTPLSYLTGTNSVDYTGSYFIFGIPSSSGGGGSTLPDSSISSGGAIRRGLLTDAQGEFTMTVDFTAPTDAIRGTAYTFDSQGFRDRTGSFSGGVIDTGSGTPTSGTFSGLRFVGVNSLDGHDFTNMSGSFYGATASNIMGSGSNGALNELMGFSGSRSVSGSHVPPPAVSTILFDPDSAPSAISNPSNPFEFDVLRHLTVGGSGAPTAGDYIPIVSSSTSVSDGISFRDNHVVYVDQRSYQFSGRYVSFIQRLTDSRYNFGRSASMLSERGDLSISRLSIGDNNTSGDGSLIFLTQGRNLGLSNPTIDSFGAFTAGTLTTSQHIDDFRSPNAQTRIDYTGDYFIYGIPSSGGGSSTLPDVSTMAANFHSIVPSGTLTAASGTFSMTVDFSQYISGASSTNFISSGITTDRNNNQSGTLTTGERHSDSQFRDLRFTGEGSLDGHDFTLQGGFYGPHAFIVSGVGSDTTRNEVMGIIGNR